jgi:hypothetical protein
LGRFEEVDTNKMADKDFCKRFEFELVWQRLYLGGCFFEVVCTVDVEVKLKHGGDTKPSMLLHLIYIHGFQGNLSLPLYKHVQQLFLQATILLFR